MRDLTPILDPPDLLTRYIGDPQAVRDQYPLGYEQLQILSNLYKKVRATDETLARQVIGSWLTQTFGHQTSEGNLYTEFTSAVRAAKDFLADLVEEFIPDAVLFPLTSDGVIRPTVDPLTLLLIMWDPPGDKRYAELRRFEAKVIWHLGLRYLIMRKQHTPPDKQLRDLTLWFERDLFIADHKEKSAEEVRITYDPNNLNRFLAYKNGQGTAPEDKYISLYLWYRYIRNGNRLISILYDSRVKREEDIFRKSLLQSAAEQPIPHDTCGITFVFRNDEELELGYETMTETVFANNASFCNLRICGAGNGDRGGNPYSSGLFQPARHFTVMTQGRLVEVQIYTIENFFNRRFSLGPENHHLYRLEQVKPLLRLLFPSSLYLDWDNPEIQRFLTAYQMEKMKTNFLGFKLS